MIKQRSLLTLILTYSIFPILIGQNESLLGKYHNTFHSEINNEFWIASSAKGFNRIKGNKTEYYVLNDSLSGLKGSYIQSKIFPETDNIFWTSTDDHLCKFSSKENKFNCFQTEINKNFLTQGYHIFYIDTTSSLLYYRADSIILELNTFDYSTKIIGKTDAIRFSKLEDEIYAAPWSKKPGIEYWAKTNQKWKKEYIDFTNCHPSLRKIQTVKFFHYDSQIWIITNYGVMKFNKSDSCQSKLIDINDHQTILYDAIIYDKYLLITSQAHGLIIFDMSTEKFILNKNCSELFSVNKITPNYIYISSKNEIFLSYPGIGVKKYNLFEILQCSLQVNDIKHSKIIKIFQDIIFTSDLNNYILIFKYENNRLDLIEKLQVSIEKIVDFEAINQTELIIAGLNDLYLFNTKNNSLQRINKTNIGQLNDLIQDNNILYVSAEQKGLLLNKADLTIGLSNSITDNLRKISYADELMRVELSESGQIRIIDNNNDTILKLNTYINNTTYNPVLSSHLCATTSGLYQIDSTYQVSQLATQPWQIGNRSISEIEYHQGCVYMTIENRLARYNTQTKELRYFTKDRFDHSPVFAIQDSVIHVAEKYVMSYDLEEAFNDTNSYILKLDELKINREALNLYQTDISNGLDLDHTQNEIAFTHYTNNWHNADLSTLRYKLLPHYPEWTMIENGEEVEFPFLPPDEYSYMVQGILPSGEMTEITTFPFVVNPPWWKTTWFYALSGIGLIGLLYALYRYRLNQLTESLRIDNEMSQLEKSALQAQMNPHFIFNCLNSIQGFIMDNDKEQAMEYLGKFAKLIRLNLNASVDSFIRLDQEILILENYLSLEQLRHDYSFSYQIHTAQDIAKEVIHIPPMLLQPFVENAVLHGMKGKESHGKIQIDFTKDQAMLVIDIRDNGSGSTNAKPSKIHRSLGMSITKKRLAHINSSESEQYAIEQIPTPEGTHNRVRILIS